MTMPEKLFDPIIHPYLCYRNRTKQTRDSLSPSYHRHDAYEIYLFLGGNIKMYIEQSCFDCEPGDMLLISPEQFHTHSCNGDCEYDRIVLNIKQDLLDKLSYEDVSLDECFRIDNINQVKRVKLTPREREEFIELFDKFQYARGHVGFGYSLLSNSYLTQILIYINRLFLSGQDDDTKNLMPELIQNVMTYIQEHLSEQITLEDLSEKFFFNGKYISRRFKKYTGLTIRTYILDQRIALAKKLLNNGCNVSEACYQSGFSDYANFIRSFTNFVGVSPGKYSKQVNPN
ncbi:MAG: helix-turn-helix domain-containing protein [Oscillospiraceae bacterium]|nr:helix-turn-helix domain-containing protein [Oscillospiraceae bacterium]